MASAGILADKHARMQTFGLSQGSAAIGRHLCNMQAAHAGGAIKVCYGAGNLLHAVTDWSGAGHIAYVLCNRLQGGVEHV